MDKATAFAAFEQARTSFLDLVVHPNGEKITRASLRNVDCFMVTEVCVVFKNKDGKYLVLPFTDNLPTYETIKVTNEKRREYPSIKEIERDFMEPIVRELIKRDPALTNETQNEILDYLPEWIRSSPSNPENKQKLEQYEILKQELTEKGLI